MDIKFQCHKCKQGIVVEEAGAGSVVDCPTCGAGTLVPRASDAVSQEANSNAYQPTQPDSSPSTQTDSQRSLNPQARKVTQIAVVGLLLFVGWNTYHDERRFEALERLLGRLNATLETNGQRLAQLQKLLDKEETPTAYEYKIEIYKTYLLTSLTELLESYGKRGWEVVSFQITGDQIVVVLKRGGKSKA